ncbi:hypothetical protein D3C85_1854700 [compost metagenome]
MQAEHLCRLREFGHRLVERGAVDVEQCDAVATRQEPAADGQADAARASGDDGDAGSR